jgi:hypothetical protein
MVAAGARYRLAELLSRIASYYAAIEHIPAELIRPDPVQPCRVLPESTNSNTGHERVDPIGSGDRTTKWTTLP